jgi:hypothetical protein
MQHALAQTSMIDEVIAGLRHHGYVVDAVAINPNFAARPARSRVNIRFGKWFYANDGIPVVAVDTAIEVRGNLHTGRLRHWRVTRSWRASRDCPCIVMDAGLILDGDINGSFLRHEGRATCDMLCLVLADVRATIAALTIADPKNTGRGQMSYDPIAVVDVGAFGTIATGHSGLVRQPSGVGAIAREKRDAMLGVADRLLHDIVPEFRAVCGETLVQSEVLPGSVKCDPPFAAETNASRASICSPTASETPAPAGAVALPIDTCPTALPFNPHPRGRHVH